MDILSDGRLIFLTTKRNGEITGINEYGALFLGSHSPEVIVGKNISEFYAVSTDREMYLQKLEKNGLLQNFEIQFLIDGALYTCLENAILKNRDDGEHFEIESVIIDISGFVDSNIRTLKLYLELATVNKKLKEAYNTMAQQEKLASIGELAAGVAHEINNPLGFVMSNSRSLHRYADAIKKALEGVTFPNKDRMDFILQDLDDILKENDEGLTRIERITASLKRFARMDSEKMTKDYDLNQAVLDTLTITKSQYKYIAEVTTNFQNVSLFECYGDAINQVILNLIVNASQAIGEKYSKKEGNIEITTRSENRWAIVKVSDNGRGVPKEAAGKIFDPFFTTKEVGKGTGLGLSLCYDIIVNKHGGKIWFENNTRGGADFIFKIPLELNHE